MIFRIFFLGDFVGSNPPWTFFSRGTCCPGSSGHGAPRAKPTSETTPGCGAWHVMSLRDPLGPFWYILPIDEWLIFMCKYTVRLRPMDSFLMLLQSLIFSCTISLNEWHLPLMYWFCGWLLHQLLRSWNSHSQVAVGCGFSWRKRSQNPPREGVFDKFQTGTGIVFGTHECWTSIEKFERKRYVPSPIKPWVSRPLQKVARKAWFIFHKGRLRCVKIWWF